RARAGGGRGRRGKFLHPRLGLRRGRPRRSSRWRPRDRRDPVIGVLVSGEGTNLQALLDADLPVVAVASDNTKARGLARAATAGIEAGAVPGAPVGGAG